MLWYATEKTALAIESIKAIHLKGGAMALCGPNGKQCGILNAEKDAAFIPKALMMLTINEPYIIIKN